MLVEKKSNEIFNLPIDTLKINLLEEFPFLLETKYASDTTLNNSIINRSVSGLINLLNKDVALKIEKTNEEKNIFIKKFNIINPITFFKTN